MADAELLLGIDIGTTNCKALLFDREGRPQATSSLPTPTRQPRPNWAEHDPETLWETVATLIRQLVSHIDPNRVRGVAVASMGEAGVLLDRHGRPTYPIIAWYDSRTVPQYRWWIEQVDAQISFPITGINPDPIYGVYKLMWLRDHAPEAYRAAVRWLHVADYIAFRLCGAQATDYSLASRTMLLDLPRRRWADSLVADAGLRHDLLPELVPSGTYLGGVIEAAAAVTGLPAGTPVGSGGHDHICGALAAGVSKAGLCLDSIGTAETALLTLGTLQLDAKHAQLGCKFGAHVTRDTYYVMDGIWSAGAAVEWIRKQLAWPQMGERMDVEAPGFYERMEATAAQAPVGSLGVFFLPHLTGGEQGAFVGLTSGTNVAALARAVYEGLAYEWRRVLEALEVGLGQHAERIRLIGGGTRSALWLQIKADVLGRPLYVLQLEESVALGAALLAGLAARIYHNEAEAVACLNQVERVVEPDPARTALYDRCYRDVFLRIAPALTDVHRAIGDLPLPSVVPGAGAHQGPL